MNTGYFVKIERNRVSLRYFIVLKHNKIEPQAIHLTQSPMISSDIKAMRSYWYGWKFRSLEQKDAIFDTWSFADLTYKMRDKARYINARSIYEGKRVDCDWHGSNMASNLMSTAAPYWSDFQDLWPHHFMKYHYTKLPEEHHEMGKKIVEALNTMKGGAWAYALCLVGFPDYEKHPLREKILKHLGCEAEAYDATANLMREIIQNDRHR